jgi:hypothetical protein
MDHLLSPTTSAQGPPTARALEAIDRAAEAHPQREENDVEPTKKNEDPRRTVEVRCPKDQCGCSPRGKLLATLIDVPVTLFGSGAVLQVACPSKKSRLLRIRL